MVWFPLTEHELGVLIVIAGKWGVRVVAQQEFVLVVAGDTLMDLWEVCMQDV